MQSSIWLVGLLVVCSIGPSIEAETWRIRYITPHTGSLNGGTAVKVFGDGFDVSPPIPGVNNPSKHIYLKSELHEYECQIHNEASDKNQIVCFTPAMKSGYYSVRMEMNGEKLELSRICGGNSEGYQCSIQIVEWRTPYITEIDKVSSTPGVMWTVTGRLFTNKSASSEESTSNIDENFIRAYIGSSNCELYDRDTNVKYGIYLKGNEGESYWGTYSCRSKGTFVGYQNNSFIIRGGFGRSLDQRSVRHISADNRIYNVQTYPVVEDVTPKQGSLRGGTLITITGKYFYNDGKIPAEVTVGGSSCKIESLTDTEIKCRTEDVSNSSSGPMYPGGRGLIVKVYNGQSDIDASLDAMDCDSRFFVDHINPANGDFPENEDNFISISKGFFVPSTTATYGFYAKADEEIKFYLNPNGSDPANKVNAISSTASGENAWSSRYFLEAGVEYYFEIHHKEVNGDEYFNVGTYWDKTDYTSDQSFYVLTETQTISITSNPVKEVQTILFENWNTTVTASDNIWTVTFNCSQVSCDGLPFAFELFETRSDIIQFASDMSALSLQIALNNFILLSGDTVEVAAGSNANKFVITFKTTRGSMNFASWVPINSSLQLSLVEDQAGVPDLNTFTFMINNQPSLPVPYSSSGADVTNIANAVLSLYRYKCPKELKEIGFSTKYYDMESNFVPSGERSPEQAYCGAYSVKNPSNLYNDNNNPYFVQSNKQVCFAYKGDISTTVSVVINYLQTDLPVYEQTKSASLSFPIAELVSSLDQWNHVCFDVYTPILSAFPQGSSFSVSQLRIFTGADTTADLYLDNIFIGSTTATSATLNEIKKRIVPPADGSVKIESVEVEKTGDAYTITYNTLDCGHNLEKLGFAFTSNVNVDPSDNHVVYSFGANETTKVHVFRNSSASPPVTGTFNIQLNDEQKQQLLADVEADVLESELETWVQIENVEVSRTGTCYGYSWKVQFLKPGGNYEEIIAIGNNLQTSPGSPSIEVSTTVNGGINMATIRGDFLRTAHSNPQVQVKIDGILAQCAGASDGNCTSSSTTSCDFVWSQSATPTFTSVTPNNVSEGNNIDIIGNGFGSDLLAVTVSVGKVACEVTSVSDTSISCTLGPSATGIHIPLVQVEGKGKADVDNSFSGITVTGSITSVSPVSGSVYGCSNVTIEGTGFDENSVVTVDSEVAMIQKVSYNQIVFTTPPGTGNGKLIKVKTSGETVTATNTFDFITPQGQVSSISPTNLFVSGNEQLLISGSDFGTENGLVLFGEKMVTINSWSDTEISVTTPSLAPGSYDIKVISPNVGCLNVSSISNVTYLLSVTSINPLSGSLAGGTIITFTGQGFTDKFNISCGDVNCEIKTVNANGTNMTCETSATFKSYNVSNDGEHPTLGNGYAWKPSTLNIFAGDSVSFKWKLASNTLINLMTTQNSSSTTFNNGLFQVPFSSAGTFSVYFAQIGTYHIISCIGESDNCNQNMRATVNVATAEPVYCDFIVSLNGHKAQGAGSARKKRSVSSFSSDLNFAAKIYSYGPRTGTVDTEITVDGDVFVDGKTTLKFFSRVLGDAGDAECTFNFVDNQTIKFKPSMCTGLKSGYYYEIEIRTDFGRAINFINVLSRRNFLLLPQVTGIHPNEGSINGGNLITVTGSGFLTRSDITPIITIGDKECEIRNEITNTTIKCVTNTPNSQGANKVEVVFGDLSVSNGNNHMFTYNPLETSEMTSVSLESDGAVRINGTGFGTVKEDFNVKISHTQDTYIGNFECDVTEAADTYIKCSPLGYPPAGVYEVFVQSDSKGNAGYVGASRPTLTIKLIVDTISPAAGSFQGGTSFVITGLGFNETQTVYFGASEIKCDSNENRSVITCVTPTPNANGCQSGTNVTVEIGFPEDSQGNSQQNFTYSVAETPHFTAISPVVGVAGDEITLNATTNHFTVQSVLLGGSKCVSISQSGSQVKCKSGEPVNRTVSADQILILTEKGYACIQGLKFTYEIVANSIAPNEGSFGGSQKIQVKGSGFSYSKTITTVRICNKDCIRVEEESNSSTLTCLTPAQNHSQNDLVCDVLVYDGENILETFDDGYTYKTSLTPVITSVIPRRAGTGGGAPIEICGNFINQDDINVFIDDVECMITQRRINGNNCFKCNVGAHTGSKCTTVNVNHKNYGNASPENLDSNEFWYIDVWNSSWTWGGGPIPKEGEFVVIQKGQTVLLDTDTPILKMLLINGGSLIFDDEKDVHLQAENILILNDGYFQIGTEAEPYQHNAKITMHGHPRSVELPVFGAKTLGVMSGTLELHGKPVSDTWTVLAANADKGSTQITLAKTVDWPVGSTIVIATTGGHLSQGQTEEAVISAISNDGTTLTLVDPLEFGHLGSALDCGSGYSAEKRAEVGLLSRNILFQGSNNDEWHNVIEACPEGFNPAEFATQTCFSGRYGEELGADQFGASIMIHTLNKGSKEAVAHIENIELNYVGQAFRLGRYPIHFHLMGDVSAKETVEQSEDSCIRRSEEGSYVRRNAIHRSFNRAVTIHGTHNLSVIGNVVYNIMGGAIFIEDGIETNNKIQYNLVVFVRQSTSLLNDDVTPAGIWVTHPGNDISHNHVAGGTHFCIWYRMHEHPDGPSFTEKVCQQRAELGNFYNNTVHSCGRFGLWIFTHYFPMKDSSCDVDDPSPAIFRNLYAYGCDKGAEWVDGGALQFHNFKIADCTSAGVDLKFVKGTTVGKEGAYLKNITVIGRCEGTSNPTEKALKLPYAPTLTIDNFNCVNLYHGLCIGVTEITGTCIDLCGGFSYFFNDVTYVNSPRRFFSRWVDEGVFYDTDGTLLKDSNGLGNVDDFLVPASALLPNVCINQTGETYSSGYPMAICSNSVKLFRFALNNAFPSSLLTTRINITNENGQSLREFRKKRLTHPKGWMGLLVKGQKHFFFFEDYDKISTIRYTVQFFGFESGEHIDVCHNIPQKPSLISIGGNEGGPDDVGRTPPDLDGNKDWYFDDLESDDPNVPYTVCYRAGSETVQRRKRAARLQDKKLANPEFVVDIFKCETAACLGLVNQNGITSIDSEPDYAKNLNLSDKLNPCVERSADNTNLIIKYEANQYIPCWVTADQDINVENLIINGVLLIKNRQLSINASHILVTGRLLVQMNREHDCQDHYLNINLYGDPNTEDLMYMYQNLGLTVPARSIVVVGGIDLYGCALKKVSWTELSETANSNQNKIKVKTPVDWEVGDEIVITTTGFNPYETEVKSIVSISSSDKTELTLNENLDHTHLGLSYSESGRTYELRAQVGLLNRNIRIDGPADQEEDAFGPHILVSGVNAWGRFENVRFVRGGKEGWHDLTNARNAITFIGVKDTNDVTPRYVKNCSFVLGYSTAIGVYDGNNITITDNVVHRSINHGIYVQGNGHTLNRNLVTMCLFRGSWGNRFMAQNYLDWHACFAVEETIDLEMIGNRASGSERLGFLSKGEDCGASSESKWFDNSAYGCLHGLNMFFTSGPSCSALNNFLVYKSWDYGIYHQTSASVKLANITILDSRVGYLGIIVGPPSLTHQAVDKKIQMSNVAVVGKSHVYASSPEMVEADHDSLRIRAISPSKAPLLVDKEGHRGGHIGVTLPMFMSGTNGAPFKGWHFQKNYPAILGKLTVDGITFSNFTKDDFAWYPNTHNQDYTHPIHVSDAKYPNVPETNKLFIQWPDVGKVNPSDCVDMDCDGMKKILFIDADGTTIGFTGAIFPKSEEFWDDASERRRGLGDYRIPTSILTDNTDGSRINPNDLFVGRGIARTGSCSYQSDWQAYKCDADYGILIVESLDEDTELRRLSPVAVACDGYIDLLNGPQDHGWCFGYTCQKRLSTFWAIVPTNTACDVTFSGTNPRDLRLRLVGNPNDKLIVKLWFSDMQRVDVFTENKRYVAPKNAEYQENSQYQELIVFRNETFYPKVANGQCGENFFDVNTRMLHVVVCHGDYVDAKEYPAVFVGFNLPSLTVEEFYNSDKVVDNLAAFLNIPTENIRVVEIVPYGQTSNGARRRRQTNPQGIQVLFMISNPPIQGVEPSVTDAISSDVLNSAVEMVIEAALTNTLSTELNVIVTDVSVFSSNSSQGTNGATINPPTALNISFLPSTIEEYLEFPNDILLTLLDAEGKTVPTLFVEVRVEVTLDTSGEDANPSAQILGETSVDFVNGTARFTALKITHLGVYNLMFEITKPSGILVSGTIPSVTVKQRQIILALTEVQQDYVYHGSEILLEVQLQNILNEPLEDVGYKGHTWFLKVSLDDDSIYGVTTMGQVTSFTFPRNSNAVTTNGLKLLNTTSFHSYSLRLRSYTQPKLYDITLFHNPIKFVYQWEVTNIEGNFANIKNIKIEISGQPFLSRSSTSSESAFLNFMNNLFVDNTDTATAQIMNLEASVNNKSNTVIGFELNAVDEDASENAIQNLENLFKTSITYKNTPIIVADPNCGIVVENKCRPINNQPTVVMDHPPSDEDSKFWIYVVVGAVIATVLAAVFITISCLMKRAKLNKIGFIHGGPCMDASSSRGSSPLMDSFGSGTSTTNVITPGGHPPYENDNHHHPRMTPVEIK